MTSLLKGLQTKHEEPPMAMIRSVLIEYINSLEQLSADSGADSGPQCTQPQSSELARQLLTAIQESLDLTTFLTGGLAPSPSVGGEATRTGIPLHIIFFGAIIGAAPGAEIASSVCATAALTNAKAKSTIRTMSRLLKSLQGVGAKKPDLKENIDGGWVDLAEEDNGTERVDEGNE